MTVADSPVAPGFWANIGIKLLGGATNTALYVRRFVKWFKASYWHAFVVGMFVMWATTLATDIAKHPVTWAAWSAQHADKMVGLPVTLPPVAVEPIAATAKAEQPAKADKKHKKRVQRQHDTRNPLSSF